MKFSPHATNMNGKRVVELVSRPARTPSGLGRYADTLARYLSAAGLPLLKHPTEIPPNLRPFAYLGNIAGLDLKTFFENYPIAGNFSPHALYHLTSENLAALLVFQSLKPAVVTVHGFFSYLLRKDPELNVYRHVIHRFFDSLVIRGLRRADHLICVSRYLENVLIEQIGIHPAKISVIHEAVDHDTFYPAAVDESVWASFGLSPDHRHILYVGSEQPRKNFLTLIRAFAQLLQRVPDALLIKVGRAEYEGERQKALDLIRALGLQDKVLFLGHLVGELPEIYRLADLFVFPSRYEGFGFPPLEAMACGTPVICSNTSSLPEVVGDGALLIEPTDKDHLAEAMELMLLDDVLRGQFIQRGLKNARRFDWRITAQETINVYHQVSAHVHLPVGVKAG